MGYLIQQSQEAKVITQDKKNSQEEGEDILSMCLNVDNLKVSVDDLNIPVKK